MRQGKALLWWLLAVLLAGCAEGSSAHSTSWFDGLRPFRVPSGSDLVNLEVVLLERPVGDPYINEDIWSYADEQAVALERKAVLQDNGFRIGEIGGPTPAGLLSLLTSERCSSDPRHIFVHAGTPRPLPLGP